MAQSFGLRYYLDAASGKEQVIHSLRTAIIGPDSKVVKVYRGNEWKPEEIKLELIKEVQAAEVKRLPPIDHGVVSAEPGATKKANK